jgi:hypothetical protein
MTVCEWELYPLHRERERRQSRRFIVQPIQPSDLAPFSSIIPHRGKQIQLR